MAIATASSSSGNRMTWQQIRQCSELQGRWVALDDCRYDARTAQPVEGIVVDVDEDLVELCSRIQESDNKHCAILFCEEMPDVDSVSAAGLGGRVAPVQGRGLARFARG